MKSNRRTSWLDWRIAAAVILITLKSLPASAAVLLQLVPQFTPSFVRPAGGGGDAVLPATSADGRYVLFASPANNLMLTANNTPIPVQVPFSLNVYLRDRASNTTALVSMNLTGTGGGNGDSLPVAVSTDGRYVLFESSASDLVAGDTNNADDVFVRDLVNGVTLLVSFNTNGASCNGASRDAAMTPDGRYVAFTSEASDLVTGDTNGIADIFVRDLQGNATTLVSVGAISTIAATLYVSSETPTITPDGRYVAFFGSSLFSVE